LRSADATALNSLADDVLYPTAQRLLHDVAEIPRLERIGLAAHP
jgi:hypothetical protein